MVEKFKQQGKKTIVGIVGGAVLVAGIFMIPYPGPGWLVVFAGLGILSTQFEWAARVLQFAKGKYDTWEDWIKHQSMWVRGVFVLLTAAVVVLTLWLLNGYGLMNDWFNLGQDWVRSPLF